MHTMNGKLLAAGLAAALCSESAMAQLAAAAKATDAVSAETTMKETMPLSSTAAQAQTHADNPAPTTTSSNWWKDTDSDGDGKISATEARANAGLDARFGAIDTDKDGFVKLEEYRAYLESNVGKTPR